MSARSTSELPSEVRGRLEQVLERFEDAWRAGQQPRLEDYLDGSGGERLALLIELVHTELHYRLRRGETVRVETYLQRHPELTEDQQVALDLIEAEYRLRLRTEPALAVEEYLGRFPQWRDELGGRLPQPTVPCAAPRETTPSVKAGGQAEQPPERGPGNGLAGSSRGYQWLDQVGRGGMAEVWRARDLDLDRTLAIKVLQERFRGDPELQRRFRYEAQVTGQLQHPGIPPVHQVGRLPDGRPFLAMKLIQGRTLAELLQERSSPGEDLPRFLGAFEQICQTLAYAHSQGVIHRDLKPSNIMVGAFGEVQVMDWGLAKVLRRADRGEGTGSEADRMSEQTASTTLAPSSSEETRSGAVLGTLAYMAPEQARGEVGQLDERCDVFGLGAILCVVLTGQPPFRGGSQDEVQARAARGDVGEALARLQASGADAELLRLARHCLAPAMADRPRDAGAVATGITSHLARVQERLRAAEVEHAAAQARAEEAVKKAAAERRARRLQAGLAAVAVVVLGLAGVGGMWWQQQKEKERLARIARQQRAAERAEALMAQAVPLRKRMRWEEAQLLLAQAGEAVEEADEEALREKVRQAKADLDLARELDEVREAKLDSAVYEWSAKRPSSPYPEVFQRYGLDVLQEPVEALARRIRTSAVRDEVLAAIDAWASAREARVFQRLLELAWRVDPDNGWRRRLLDPAIWDNGERRRALLAQARQEDLAPTTALFLAYFANLGTPQARELLERARERHPNDFWLNFTLAIILRVPKEKYVEQRDRSRQEEAIGYYRAAVAIKPDSSRTYVNLGLALYTRNDVEGAIRCYEEALRLDPEHAQAYYDLGMALYRRNDLEGAIHSFKLAICLDPNHAAAHHNLGAALMAYGDYAQGCLSLQKGYDLYPRSHPLARWYATKGRAMCRQALELEQQLEAVRAGKQAPKGPAQRLLLAQIARLPAK
jgi:serine/threonine-protein kinase